MPLAGWPEAMAALALGLLLAALVGLLLRTVAFRPPSARQTLMAELAALHGRSDGERLAGQAALLRRVKPGAIPGLSEAIYQRQPQLSPDDVEREILHLIKTARV